MLQKSSLNCGLGHSLFPRKKGLSAEWMRRRYTVQVSYERQELKMKKSLGIAVIALSLTTYAQIDMPRQVLNLSDIKKAQTEATREKKALIFLKVNPHDSREFMETAVKEYVRQLRRYGPILLVPLDADPSHLPAVVVQAFDSLSGSYPQVVVIDPGDNSVIAKIPYLSQNDRDQELKEYRRSIHRHLQEAKSRRTVPVPEPMF
jgi:hypothetical protein